MGLRLISVEGLEHLHQFSLKAVSKFRCLLAQREGGKKLLNEIRLMNECDEQLNLSKRFREHQSRLTKEQKHLNKLKSMNPRGLWIKTSFTDPNTGESIYFCNKNCGTEVDEDNESCNDCKNNIYDTLDVFCQSLKNNPFRKTDELLAYLNPCKRLEKDILKNVAQQIKYTNEVRKNKSKKNNVL